MIKNISILGSTGSIGTQTLDVIRNYPDMFKVLALSCNNNIELLAEQINEFKPLYVSVYSDKEASNLLKLIDTNLTQILTGNEGLNYIASLKEADTVVVALVGITGLIPTLEAIKQGKTIALANKETLVSGGSLVIPQAIKYNAKILPVDSEHSAIFQCIQENQLKSVKKIIITASGGPFRTWDMDSINTATPNQALAHPNWVMGQKVTIDSATLMNKCLEIIEAHWLFNIDYNNIEVLIHPQSIVHSLVEFIDGTTLAQMSNPTMHLPIQYALTYPERLHTDLVKPLNLSKICKLEFYLPDQDKFPCLNLAYKVGKLNGTYPVVLNAANEIAVDAYLSGVIRFCDIYNLVNTCINEHKCINNPSLQDILNSDNWARQYSKESLLPSIVM